MNAEQERNKNLLGNLQGILDSNRDKRVIVVGTTCTGKSTFIKNISVAHDMDELVFPQLTKEESDYVCQTPWTPEIGRTMARLVREKVKVEPGKPVFGTIVLDSDLIVELEISDDLLRERAQRRDVDFEDANNMKKQIEEEIVNSKIPTIKFPVG